MINNRFHRIILFASAIFLFLSPHIRICTVLCSEPADENKGKWVLLGPFVGEGYEWNATEGDITEGSFDRWTADEKSLKLHSRRQRVREWGTEELVEATFEFSLPEFPGELIPGQKVELEVTGTAEGYMREGYFPIHFEFFGSSVTLSGSLSSKREVWWEGWLRMSIDVDYENWIVDKWVKTETEIPDTDTLTIKFDVPEGSEGDEFEFVALLLGGVDTNVKWVYQFEAPKEMP